MTRPYKSHSRTWRTLSMLERSIEWRNGKLLHLGDDNLIVRWKTGEVKYEVTTHPDRIEIDAHLYWDLNQ